MIAVCEPSCARTSHESPNAGFIAALLQGFPNEDIFFYGEKEHLSIIKAKLHNAGFDVSRVKFFSMHIAADCTILTLFLSFWACFRMLLQIQHLGCDRILFLGAHPIQEYVLKMMCAHFFSTIYCTFVLHGEVESISGKLQTITPLLMLNEEKQKSLVDRLRGKGFWQVCARVLTIFKKNLDIAYRRFCTIRFSVKKSLLFLQETGRFSHIVLSPHVIQSMRNYIDTDMLSLHVLIMPAIYPAKPFPRPINNFMKFGIFGYGNSGMLQNVNKALAQLDVKCDYEIRIIGMDGRGIENYTHVTHPIPRVLARAEMEYLVRDIDMLLILYEDFRYKLSCSASIIEAHTYVKPVMYLRNECIDFFNPAQRPVGISCADHTQMAEQMQRIINNYSSSQDELAQYYNNILCQRESIDVMNNINVLKRALFLNN